MAFLLKLHPKWGHRYWNKHIFWNTFFADQLVFQNRGFTVLHPYFVISHIIGPNSLAFHVVQKMK